MLSNLCSAIPYPLCLCTPVCVCVAVSQCWSAYIKPGTAHPQAWGWKVSGGAGTAPAGWWRRFQWSKRETWTSCNTQPWWGHCLVLPNRNTQTKTSPYIQTSIKLQIHIISYEGYVHNTIYSANSMIQYYSNNLRHCVLRGEINILLYFCHFHSVHLLQIYAQCLISLYMPYI